MRTRDTFFAQSTDSHEVNFANADTSSLIDAVIYFSSLKVKNPSVDRMLLFPSATIL